MIYQPQFAGRQIAALALAALSGCATTIDAHTPPPADFPKLTPKIERASFARTQSECGGHVVLAPVYAIMACTRDVDFCARTVRVILWENAPGFETWLAHELMHVKGHGHQWTGYNYMAEAWEHYKTRAGPALCEARRIGATLKLY